MESDNAAIVITCEHAGNHLPEAYRHLFEGSEQVLATHRGFDPGALELAECMASHLNTTPVVHLITRLLVDVNRSLRSSTLFSEFTAPLSKEDKQFILDNWYRLHRNRVEAQISNIVTGRDRCRVVHLGVHTFTNMFEGNIRNTDVGLLYDPSRAEEVAFCKAWGSLLREQSSMRVRFNYPYRGVADGLVTYLRKRFPPNRYSGIELEVNQKFFEGSLYSQQNIMGIFANTLKDLFQGWGRSYPRCT